MAEQTDQHPAGSPSPAHRGGPTDLIVPQRAAGILGVAPGTVAKYVEQGLLTEQRTPGGHRRYRLAEVLALVARSQSPA